MNYVVLYNPYSDNRNGEYTAQTLSVIFNHDEFEYVDITKIDNYRDLFSKIPIDYSVVICGGDGTLNRFINDTASMHINHKLFYWPCGSGNDFARDVGFNQILISLNQYIQDLPIVNVNGVERRFINAVGFGIDGYCCEIGDKMRKEGKGKKINYTSIAIKGLLFHYKPTTATITVDDQTTVYKKVWIAPTMFGKYYGGGMMPAPKQSRNNVSGNVSVMVFHNSGKLKTLCIFPSLFKGEHVKYKNNVSVIQGRKITVRFQSPRTIQIDGETITGITEYTVKSADLVASEDRKKRIG